MRRALVVVVCALGCGDVAAVKMDAPPKNPDAADPSTDSGSTARCDPNKPFGTLMPLDTINSTAMESGASLMPDELTIYFGSTRTGNGTQGMIDLWVATRSSITADFGAPALLANVNTDTHDDWPSITADGLYLYMSRHYPATTGWDIYVAQRASTAVDFGTPMAVPSLMSSGGLEDAAQFVLSDHSAIYFASTRGNAGANEDTYRAARNVGGTFDVPVAVGLPTAGNQSTAVLPADELTIYFSADSPMPTLGAHDIYMAKRSTKSDGFGTPVLVTELSSSVTEHVLWISADGCNIYIERTVTNRLTDIFVAKKPL